MGESSWGMSHAPDERTASAERLAYEAYERGDALFQIDITLAAVQGISQLGSSSTRVMRAQPTDMLGPIERQGWKLEHVGVTFVETGSSASKRVLAHAGSTEVANHGQIVGLYVFRRGQRAEPKA